MATAPLDRAGVLPSQLTDGMGILIDGEWREASETFTTTAPATGSDLLKVANANSSDVSRAVQSAVNASEQWRAARAVQRRGLIEATADAIAASKEVLARVEAVDTGNPLTYCRRDVDVAVANLRYMAGLALETKGATTPPTIGKWNLTFREPYGVVARISSYNHPVLYMAKALGAPLIAGNSVVVKPSPLAPLSAMLLTDIVRTILPPGLLNLVNGRVETGRSLVSDPSVRRISFTGSLRSGLSASRDAGAQHVKEMTLETGGKNVIIVFADSDIEKSAHGVVAGMHFNTTAGQSCTSTSRLLVEASVQDEVLELVRAEVERIRIGDPLDPLCEMGPVISEQQLERIESYVAGGLAAGAEVVCGGHRPQGDLAAGWYYRPTVLKNVSPDSRVAREEIFGPVLAVTTFTADQEAVRLANDSDFGLTASVWTRDLERAVMMADRVEAGYIWINGAGYQQLGAPFGGYKDSGNARTSCLDELLTYTRIKNVSLQ